MHRLNIRWTLTLWYGGVLAVVLFLFSLVIYLELREELLDRIDQGLHEELAEVVAEVSRHETRASLQEWLQRRFAHHEGFDYQVTDQYGERIFANPRLLEEEHSFPVRTATKTASYENVPLGTAGTWRVVATAAQGPDGPLSVRVGRSLSGFEHETTELLLTFLLTGPLALLIASGGGYLLARRALRPVQVITQTARQISAERLKQTFDVDNPHDELGELATTFNEMIERLDCSFTEMQRFTADAAHELRTPLAIIRNEAEVALRTTRSSEEYCQVIGNLLEETNRLSNIADQLLFLSRQDAGLQTLEREVVAIDDLLQEVAGNMQLVAQTKGVSLECPAESQAKIQGDQRQLRRVFYNLLDNAIKYTEAGGSVTLMSQATSENVHITVMDTGCGIAADCLPRVFDRFYRCDPARSEVEGAGLGLSICQSIVRAHGGHISIESAIKIGTTVSVTLALRGKSRLS